MYEISLSVGPLGKFSPSKVSRYKRVAKFMRNDSAQDKAEDA